MMGVSGPSSKGISRPMIFPYYSMSTIGDWSPGSSQDSAEVSTEYSYSASAAMELFYYAWKLPAMIGVRI